MTFHSFPTAAAAATDVSVRETAGDVGFDMWVLESRHEGAYGRGRRFGMLTSSS